VTSICSSRITVTALYRNDGGLKFTEISHERGIDLNGHGVTSGWGDLDNDGSRSHVGNFIAGQPRIAMRCSSTARRRSSSPAGPDLKRATHGVQFATSIRMAGSIWR
jgi:hypothetical protein